MERIGLDRRECTGAQRQARRKLPDQDRSSPFIWILAIGGSRARRDPLDPSDPLIRIPNPLLLAPSVRGMVGCLTRPVNDGRHDVGRIRTSTNFPDGGSVCAKGAPRSITVPTRLSADGRFAWYTHVPPPLFGCSQTRVSPTVRELTCVARASFGQIVAPEYLPLAAWISTPMGTARPDTTCCPLHDPTNGNWALAGIRGRLSPPAGGTGASPPGGACRRICADAGVATATAAATAVIIVRMAIARCTSRSG